MPYVITYKTATDVDPLLRITLEQEDKLRAAKVWPLKGRQGHHYSGVHFKLHRGLPTFHDKDIARIIHGEHPITEVFDKQRTQTA